jgi:hypothetical protein
MNNHKLFTKSKYSKLPNIFIIENGYVKLSPNVQMIDLYKTYFRYIGFTLPYVSTVKGYNNNINQSTMDESVYKLICDPNITDNFIKESIIYYYMDIHNYINTIERLLKKTLCNDLSFLIMKFLYN